MKSKTLILMVVAVVCGLAASYMTSRLLADRTERVSILVAKARYAPWTPIKNVEDQFDLEERPKNEVPRNAVTKFEAAKDHILIKGIDKGDPLVAENMLSKEKGGLEVLLPQGKRAIAVRTTAEQVAGGFVLPGSRVDVIHSIRHGDKESESHVVLQNILVRAVDTLSMKPEDKPGLVPATVTLEVTPQQALVLSRVKDVGSLTLALRPFGDDQVSSTDYAPPAPKPVAPPPPPPKPVVVQAPPPRLPSGPLFSFNMPNFSLPKPKAKTHTMVVQNGAQWVRATFVTQDGQVQTTIERSQEAVGEAPPAPARPSK